MIKKQSIIIIIFLMLSGAVSANSGLYLALEGGSVSTSTPFPISILSSSDTSGLGWRAATGYLFGKNHFNYGIETGVLVYPHLSGSECSIFNPCYKQIADGYDVDLLGVLKYTFDSQFLVLAKGGAVYNNQIIHNENDQHQWENKHGISYSPEIALGIGYQFPYHAEISLTGNAMVSRLGLTTGLLLGISYWFA